MLPAKTTDPLVKFDAPGGREAYFRVSIVRAIGHNYFEEEFQEEVRWVTFMNGKGQLIKDTAANRKKLGI